MAHPCIRELHNHSDMKINNILTAVFMILTVSLLSACEADFQNGNKDKFNQLPDTPLTSEEDTNKTYTINHPSLMHTDADFTRVADYIKAGMQPWTDAWEFLKKTEFTRLDDSFTNDAPDHLERNPYQQGQWEGNFKTAIKPGLAAYYLGLCWRISTKLGEKDADKYAVKAARILDNWVTTCQYVKVEDSHDHYALLVGFDGHRFIQAVELLCDYEPWVSAGGLDAAKSWLRKCFAEPAKRFISEKTTPFQSWGGWEIPCLNTMLNVGIICEDQDLINEVVNYVVHGCASGCIGNLVVALHQDPAGLGKGFCLGQSDESGRDQDHAGLSVATLAPLCIAARNIGEDLFGIKANDQFKDKNGNIQYRYPQHSEYGDVCLPLAFFEYYAKYNVDKYETVEMPFTFWETRVGKQEVIASAGRGHFYPGYEALYDHYRSHGYDAPYCRKFAEKYRSATSEKPYEFDNDFPGIGTLMYYRGQD